ncbi:MAG: glycosyltransferase family 39 protein [Anaerolineae bacterium]|nr:glycosyltransferase family 39 protein [Anaerolineae bacterium]
MMTHRRWLLLLLALGLILRLAYGLSQPPFTAYTGTGGDSGWYLLNGLALVGGRLPEGMQVDISTLQPPPGYLIFVGIPQLFLPLTDAVRAILVLQALLSTATCYLAYLIAEKVAGERAGLFALAVLAFSPAFILESGQVVTETLYLFLLAAAFVVYLSAIERTAAMSRPDLARLAGAGALFGLATLTRAVLLLFPLGLMIHFVLVHRSSRTIHALLALGLSFALVVSTWTIYNLARWDRFVLAGEGFGGLIYAGTVGWEGPNELDAQLEQDASPDAEGDIYLDAAANVIRRDLPAYLRRRLGELVGAYLQPHNTPLFPGESLRVLAQDWWTQDRSLGGVGRIIQGDAFWPKLMLYVAHFGALLFGTLGMWTTRRQWRLTLPLIGFVAYVTLIHLALYALPRYLFPALMIGHIFAALWFASRFHGKTRLKS